MSEQKTKPENVFRSRNFRLVYFGALVSDLGAVLYSFAVSFYILEISANNAFLQGLYLAVCGAALLLATPFGGVLGDRFNKAKIMFICDYLKGGMILLAVAGMLWMKQPAAHIAILFMIGILGNIVSGIFSPAASALLPHIVAEEKLQQANAYYSIKNALQNIFGIVLAGIMYSALPVTILFCVVGVCYLISGLSEMFIRYQHVPGGEKLTLRIVFGDMGEGMKYLRTQKAIMAMMGAILFINFFFTPIYGNFIPYFVKTDIAGASSYLFDNILTPELWSSVFNVLFGISSLIGSVILSSRETEKNIGRKTAFRVCDMAGLMIMLSAAYWFLIARNSSLNLFLILFCLAICLTGFLLAFVNIPLNTTLMRVVERNMLSKVSGIISVLSQGLTPIASVLAGVILQWSGSAVLLMACSLGLAVSALSLLFNKDIRTI